MPIIDAGTVDIAYLNEATFGVNPGGTPKLWRVTEKGMNRERNVQQSRELGTEGQQGAGNHGRQQHLGSFGGELGRDFQDDALAWMINAPAVWTADASGTGDHIDVTNAKRGLTVFKNYATSQYRQWNGVACSEFEFAADPDSNPLLTFRATGLSGGDLTATPPATSPASSFTPYGQFEGDMDIGGISDASFITGIRLAGNWQYETANVLFDRDPAAVSRGNLVLTGEITFLMDTADGFTLMGYGDTEQLVPVSWQFQESATVFHRFFLPAVKFWPSTDNPGQTGAFPVTMRFGCEKGDPSSIGGGSSTPVLMRIQRDYGV